MMIPPLSDRVADAVAQAEKKYNVKEIAALCGVSVQTVYDWRKKKTINLKGETLVELSEVSGLNSRWIINGKGLRESGPLLSQDEQIILDAYRYFDKRRKDEWMYVAKTEIAERGDNQSKAA